MSDSKVEIAGPMEWGALIEEARMALSTLRAGDLEQLAARAEKMFAESVGREAQPQRKPELFAANLYFLSAQHRSLGNLLSATSKNLEVLRRLQSDSLPYPLAERRSSPWVR